MAIPKGRKADLNTIILRAAKAGRLAVVECQDKTTGQTVNVLCAISTSGAEFGIVPFAQLFDENPYERLNPPNPEGGFFEN